MLYSFASTKDFVSLPNDHESCFGDEDDQVVCFNSRPLDRLLDKTDSSGIKTRVSKIFPMFLNRNDVPSATEFSIPAHEKSSSVQGKPS